MNNDQVDAVDHSKRFYRSLPAWLSGGSLSGVGAEFLASSLLASGASTVVEIGTASGFSTALMASVLDAASRTGRVREDFRVVTIDVSKQWYVDKSREVGQAAREVVPELLDHIEFLNPATAADVPARFPEPIIEFLFIDGNHAHPWPIVDLLLCLPALAPESTVVLDDINLPLLHPEWPDWGAHRLFYGVRASNEEGARFEGSSYSSMGKLTVPSDKTDLRRQLLAVLDAHDWQVDIPSAVEQQARQL